MHDEHCKRQFVEPTITPEASLADVTLLSHGRGSQRHGHGNDKHGGGGRHGGGRGEHHGGGGRGH